MKTTRDTLKRACYQYLLDHSFPSPKGKAVSMLLPKENAFYKKIMARERGYKRINDSTAEKDLRKYLNHQSVEKRYAKKYHKAVEEGTWKLRLAIKIRARLKRYIDKQINEKNAHKKKKQNSSRKS